MVREPFSTRGATHIGRVLVIATIKDGEMGRRVSGGGMNGTNVPPDGQRLGRFYQYLNDKWDKYSPVD